jgi:hypothetical protein
VSAPASAARAWAGLRETAAVLLAALVLTAVASLNGFPLVVASNRAA